MTFAADVLYVHVVRDVNVQACAATNRPLRASSQGQEAPGLLEERGVADGAGAANRVDGNVCAGG